MYTDLLKNNVEKKTRCLVITRSLLLPTWNWRADTIVRMPHWGRNKAAAISQTTFPKYFHESWFPYFHSNCFKIFFLRGIPTISSHWFKQWLCVEQAISRCLNQWWLNFCIPADTRRNDNVVFTSKRRRVDAIMTLLLRLVPAGI